MPPGQKYPTPHSVAFSADVEPATQPYPGAPVHIPEQAALISPNALPYVPAAQSVGDEVALVGQYAPRGHGKHVALVAAPTVDEYVPALHGVGSTDESGQYDPAGQRTGMPDAQKNAAGQGLHVSCRMLLPPVTATESTPAGVTATCAGDAKTAAAPHASTAPLAPLPASVTTRAVAIVIARTRLPAPSVT